MHEGSEVVYVPVVVGVHHDHPLELLEGVRVVLEHHVVDGEEDLHVFVEDVLVLLLVAFEDGQRLLEVLLRDVWLPGVRRAYLEILGESEVVENLRIVRCGFLASVENFGALLEPAAFSEDRRDDHACIHVVFLGWLLEHFPAEVCSDLEVLLCGESAVLCSWMLASLKWMLAM